MPTFVDVTLRNSTPAQHVCHATDDVLGQPALADTPLGSGESAPVRLVADENGHGRMTFGFRGEIDTSRIDLNDGDVVDVS
jgi:hypothetical protein